MRDRGPQGQIRTTKTMPGGQTMPTNRKPSPVLNFFILFHSCRLSQDFFYYFTSPDKIFFHNLVLLQAVHVGEESGRERFQIFVELLCGAVKNIPNFIAMKETFEPKHLFLDHQSHQRTHEKSHLLTILPTIHVGPLLKFFSPINNSWIIWSQLCGQFLEPFINEYDWNLLKHISKTTKRRKVVPHFLNSRPRQAVRCVTNCMSLWEKYSLRIFWFDTDKMNLASIWNLIVT